MSPLEDELEVALGATSPQSATLALCRAWGRCPSTRLARVARAFSGLTQHPGVSGPDEAAREAAWVALAEAGRPEDTDTLLATPWGGRPKLAAQRLRLLEQRGPDPRVVAHLLDLDTGYRYSSEAGFRFWVAAYELLLGWGSVEAAARLPRGDAASPWELARQRDIFTPLLDRWAGRLPSEPHLPEGAVARLVALEQRLAPLAAVTDGLRAAVQARPDDAAPRRVLADALAERGDPRGEFIALQLAHAEGALAPAREEHMRRLLAAAGRRWFDGLEPQLSPRAVFRDGFLSEVELSTRSPDPTLPAWRTVEVIAVGGVAMALSGFLAHPNLAGVHTLVGAWGGTIEELVRNGGPRTFRLLEIGRPTGRELPRPAWRVERLRLRSDVDQAVWWFGAGRLGVAVDVLSLHLHHDTSVERVGPALEALRQQGHALAAVEFTARAAPWPQPWAGEWALRFEAGPDRRFEQLEVSIDDQHYRGLTTALASLPRGAVRAVRVRSSLEKWASWRLSVRAAIEGALERQGRLDALTFDLDEPAAPRPRPVIHLGL